MTTCIFVFYTYVYANTKTARGWVTKTDISSMYSNLPGIPYVYTCICMYICTYVTSMYVTSMYVTSLIHS